MQEWLKESILIILALGGLESIYWFIDRRGVLEDRKELKEQTKILEIIAEVLSIEEEDEEEEEDKVETPSYN